MAGTIIELDIRDLLRATRALERLANFDHAELLDGIGALHESQVRRRIADEKTGPDGQPWPNWSAAYAADRPANKSLLQDSGDLLDDIHYLVEGESVYIGNSLVYARTHQEGDSSRNIPARPYLGLSAENEEDIRDELRVFFEDLLQ